MKNFPKLRRPRPAPTLLNRLGGRVGALWRKLSGAAPPAPAHHHHPARPVLRPHAERSVNDRSRTERSQTERSLTERQLRETPGSTQEELWTDLKIAVPKSRPGAGRPRAARTGPMAEAALKKKFTAPAEELKPAPLAPARQTSSAASSAASPAAPAPRRRPAKPAAEEPLAAREVFSERVAEISAKPSPRLKPRRRLAWAACLAAVCLAAGAYWSYRQYFKTPLRAKVARIPVASLPKVAPLRPGFFERYALERASAEEATAAPGSSLGKVLEEAGLKDRQSRQGVLDCLTGGDDPVSVIQPGAVVKVQWADQGRTELSRVEFQPGPGLAPLVVRPWGAERYWRYSLASRPLTVVAAGAGAVADSLWNAGLAAGLDGGLIMSMADLLASDIDFLTDIKKGDSFQILYSRDYLDGRPLNSPIIEMVKMENSGRTYEYYRYINARGQAGFYNRDGQSNQKTFFVTPLQYTRISSGFSMARRHPIYKVVRPHQGVDYAAPAGTPVSAVAAGQVVAARWSGGFGRLITIKHDSVYTTMYGHLSSFGPGIREGVAVKQGELIGRVGATGAATGPHLDFRLLKNGAPINPIPELAKQIGRKLEGADSAAFASVVPLLQKRLAAQLQAQETRRSAAGQEVEDEPADL